MENKRNIGTQYEMLALSYLENKGFKIICQNYRCRLGEIDIIAQDGIYLVFIEVKYRTDLRKGDPSEAINYHKKRIITNVAKYYIKKNILSEYTPCRFDAIVILGQEMRHIENAFDAI